MRPDSPRRARSLSEPAAAAALGHLPKQQVLGGGAQLPLGPVRLYLTYMHNSLDGTAVGKGTQFDEIGILGVAYQVRPALMLKAEYTDDRGKTLNGVLGRNGTKDTAVVSVELRLSPRTSVYAAASDNRYQSGYKLETLNIAGLARDPNASSIQPRRGSWPSV